MCAKSSRQFLKQVHDHGGFLVQSLSRKKQQVNGVIQSLSRNKQQVNGVIRSLSQRRQGVDVLWVCILYENLHICTPPNLHRHPHPLTHGLWFDSKVGCQLCFLSSQITDLKIRLSLSLSQRSQGFEVFGLTLKWGVSRALASQMTDLK
jgi:hypothetical protein